MWQWNRRGYLWVYFNKGKHLEVGNIPWCMSDLPNTCEATYTSLLLGSKPSLLGPTPETLQLHAVHISPAQLRVCRLKVLGHTARQRGFLLLLVGYFQGHDSQQISIWRVTSGAFVDKLWSLPFSKFFHLAGDPCTWTLACSLWHVLSSLKGWHSYSSHHSLKRAGF